MKIDIQSVEISGEENDKSKEVPKEKSKKEKKEKKSKFREKDVSGEVVKEKRDINGEVIKEVKKKKGKKKDINGEADTEVKKAKEKKEKKEKTKKKKSADENSQDKNLVGDGQNCFEVSGIGQSMNSDPEPEVNKSKPTTQKTTKDLEKTKEQSEGDLSNFRISDVTLRKLKNRNITHLFPIQYKTYDSIYDGNDVIGQARTGTGKTLSFALPLVEILQKERAPRVQNCPKVVVMVPTRELAKQVSEEFVSITNRLNVSCFYGGTPYDRQMRAIQAGIDVLVGTPGRIKDHIERGNLDFTHLRHVVLDEVDKMLDMGFADDVEKIISAAYKKDSNENPQTLLFSATLPKWVHDTARKYMDKERMTTVSLVGYQDTKTSTSVKHLAIRSSFWDRPSVIGDVLQVYSGKNGRAIIFNETKKECDDLSCSEHIKQDAHVLHGDIPQEKRETVLKSFREGKFNVLITTDVAARGLDIPEVDLVIQCNPPEDVDSYIHRSGRTGRAGKSGVSICFYKPEEETKLANVEYRAKLKFKRVSGPTKEDIIKASTEDAVRSIESVPAETLDYFRDSALELIKERGAEDALSAALALISGSTKITSRSMLSSKEGFTTYLLQTNQEIQRLNYVYRALERCLPKETVEKLRWLTLCKDKMGAVFDLPCECEAQVLNYWSDGKFDKLCKATELPELQEKERPFNSGYRGFGGQGRGRGSDSRGFRGRGRGFGSSGRFSGSQRGFGNRGGFKRSGNFSHDSQPNKKIKF